MGHKSLDWLLSVVRGWSLTTPTASVKKVLQLNKKWFTVSLSHNPTKSSFKQFHHAFPTTTLARSIRRNVYIRRITVKRVTSKRGPSPHHCAWATQLLSTKCCSGGEPLTTLCPIWPARDLNLIPPAPETNALPLETNKRTFAANKAPIKVFKPIYCNFVCNFIKT